MLLFLLYRLDKKPKRLYYNIVQVKKSAMVTKMLVTELFICVGFELLPNFKCPHINKPVYNRNAKWTLMLAKSINPFL